MPLLPAGPVGLPPVVNTLVGGLGQNDLVIGTLYFYFQGQGWQEKHIMQAAFNGATDNAGRYRLGAAHLNEIARRRAYLLPNNCYIAWGRVSLASVLRDSVAAFSSTLSSRLLSTEAALMPPAIEYANEPNDGLQTRYEDGIGRFANRIIRCVRDSWIANNQIITDINTDIVGAGSIVNALPAPPLFWLAAAPTAAAAINDYLVTCQAYTAFSRPLTTTPKSYFTFNLTNVLFRYAGSRRTGRYFDTPRGRAVAKV